VLVRLLATLLLAFSRHALPARHLVFLQIFGGAGVTEAHAILRARAHYF
jgi:hypothetical protein